MTFLPREGVTESCEGIVSHLHVGIIVGNVKMFKNERMSDDILFCCVSFGAWCCCCCCWYKFETEGEDPRRTRSLSETSSDSKERKWVRFEGRILRLFLVVAVHALVLL